MSDHCLYLFAFALEVFALALSGRVCVATSRLDILRQVIVAGKQVGGKIEEIAGQDVWVLLFPRCNY